MKLEGTTWGVRALFFSVIFLEGFPVALVFQSIPWPTDMSVLKLCDPLTPLISKIFVFVRDAMNDHKITLSSPLITCTLKPSLVERPFFLAPFLSSGSLLYQKRKRGYIPHALLAPLTRPKWHFSSLSNASHVDYQAPAKFISTMYMWTQNSCCLESHAGFGFCSHMKSYQLSPFVSLFLFWLRARPSSVPDKGVGYKSSTTKENDEVLLGGSSFWVCRQNPTMRL